MLRTHQPALGRPTSQRRLTVLQEAQFLVRLLVVGGHQSHDDVGVAVHVLGGRVHHQVGAQRQRLLETEWWRGQM